MKPNPNWRGDPTFIPDLFRHFGVPFKTLPGWDKWGMGDFGRIQGVFWHHTGSNNTSAAFIKNNGNMNGAASSLGHISRAAILTLCAIGVSWHAGKGWGHGWPKNNANPVSLGWEIQSNGTDQWNEDQLDITRRATAAILWFLGHRATIEHMIGHWEYSLDAQGKWDPGSGKGIAPRWHNDREAMMDMNHQRNLVNAYIDNINRYGRLDPPPAGPSIPEGSSVSILTPTYLTDFIKGFIGPQFDVLAQVRDLLQDVQTQLRGPGLGGWVQLGQNSKGQNLTVPDALAALRHDISRLEKKIDEVRS